MAKLKVPPQEAARSFGVGRLTRHLFICLGPDCVDAETGERVWNYVKGRMKALNIAGPDGPCYRTKCQCLRICNEGPICVVYPEGVWYRNVTRKMPSASFRNTSSVAASSMICASRETAL